MSTIMPYESKRRTFDVQDSKWIDIIHPTAQDLEALQKEFHFHPLDIEDVLKERQRPKLIEHPDYFFLEIHLPLYDREKRQTRMVWMDLFVTRTHVITIHKEDIPVLLKFQEEFDPVRIPIEPSRPTGFIFLKLLSYLYYSNFPKLDKIAEKLGKIETQLFKGQERKAVEDLLYIKSDLISFRRIIRPQLSLLQPLFQEQSSFFSPEMKERLHDIQSLIVQNWSTLENLFETSSSLDTTTHEIISHNLNKKMRTLTFMTIMLFPLSVFLSFIRIDFPGNPFYNIPYMFWYTILIGLIIILVGYWYFREKELL